MNQKTIFFLFIFNAHIIFAAQSASSTKQTFFDTKDIEKSIQIVNEVKQSLETSEHHLDKYIAALDNNNKIAQAIDQSLAAASHINSLLNKIAW